MSQQLCHLDIQEFANIQLSKLCPENVHQVNFPAVFYCKPAEIICDMAFTTSITAKNTHTQPAFETSEYELVVFDNITLKQLQNLTQYSGISITAVNAINNRAKRTSWRFSIQCKTVSESRQKLIDFCHPQQIEAAIIANAPKLSEKGLLVMDMDSTAIEIECIDEIAKLAGEEIGKQISEVTELAMQGKLDFSESLKQRVAKLAGADESIIAQVKNNLPLMPGLTELVQQLKQRDWIVAIASGGFTYFAEALKNQLKLDAVFANQLAIANGKLTGEVLGDIVDAQAKANCIKNLAAEHKISAKQTVAMGDGANDLLMMATAALGVAFDAKETVKLQADVSILQKDLTLLLHWLK